MQNKTLVFTATFNEVENIKNFLNIVLKINDIDVLIIDDNSPDGTSKIIEEHQLKAKNLFLVKREKKRVWTLHIKVLLILLKKKTIKN